MEDLFVDDCFEGSFPCLNKGWVYFELIDDLMVGGRLVSELVFEYDVLIEYSVVDVFEEVEGVVSFEEDIHVIMRGVM